MEADATGRPGTREETLRARLAELREAHRTAVATIEQDIADGTLTAAQAADAARIAQATYDRARALAGVEAAHPGWHCWPGVIPPLLYARRLRSSPPMVVRAATLEALAEAIERAEAGRVI